MIVALHVATRALILSDLMGEKVKHPQFDITFISYMHLSEVCNYSSNEDCLARTILLNFF